MRAFHSLTHDEFSFQLIFYFIIIIIIKSSSLKNHQLNEH